MALAKDVWTIYPKRLCSTAYRAGGRTQCHGLATVRLAVVALSEHFLVITAARRYCDPSCLLVGSFVSSYVREHVLGRISRKKLETEVWL